MRLLINTAVIPEPGVYSYELIDVAGARVWLASSAWESRIGYPRTADYIERTLGTRPVICRDATYLDPGDEALVVRLTYRIQDVRAKASGARFENLPQEWEIGILRRLS